MTNEKSSKHLRDFIYIDKDRLYSLYSQLFEGVAESMIRAITYGTEDTSKERKLEETIVDASTKVQNVILFDHIYNTLEDKMLPQMVVVSEETTIEEIKPDSIVKITGFARIEDYEHLLYLLRNFNEIGQAFSTLKLSGANPGGQPSNNAIEKHAKENNLYMNKKYIDSMAKIIEELHGPSFEILIPYKSPSFEVDFRAFLDKHYLRLSQETLKSLYGYLPNMAWTVVGEITNLSYDTASPASIAKGLLTDLFNGLENINNSFAMMINSGKTIRIAPIAVYVEHQLFTGKEGASSNESHET